MKSQDNEPESDPFQCKCGTCRKFWKKTFPSNGSEKGANSALLYLPAEERAAKTSMMYAATRIREEHPAVLKVGDRVIVRDKYQGVVKFVGILDENLAAPDAYVGVQLDDNIRSSHNGVCEGKRYFHCLRGHGMMVKYAEVIRVNPPEVRPTITGNDMFPSFKMVQKKRLARSIKDPDNDLGWSYRQQSAVYICDQNDVAAKDIKRNELREKQRIQLLQERERNRQIREDTASKQSVQRWKEEFGGGKQGEKMAITLQKLHKAYEMGLALNHESSTDSG